MTGRKRHLSLYLMKRKTTVDDAIRDLSKVSRHELSDPDLEGILFVKTNTSSLPWWVEFLNPLAQDDLGAPASRSTGAVLSLKLGKDTDARTVCFTFGHGRYLLDPNRIDRSFGLKVALNAMDPLKLRGLDARRQEDVVVNSRVQSSIGTDLATFNIDIYRDIVTRAAGATLETHRLDLGDRVYGSTGVSFDVPIAPEDLVEKAQKILDLYKLDSYKRSFAFVDHMQPVDPVVSVCLDDRLVTELLVHVNGGSRTFRCLYLAAPEVLDLAGLEGFVFTSEYGSNKTAHAELTLEDYLKTRRNRKQEIDKSVIRRDKVLLRYGGEVDLPLNTVYRCIIAEVEVGKTTFQLVDGKWYEIESSFVTDIQRRVLAIPTANIDFPDHRFGDEEREYNCQAAERLDALVMDRHNIRLGGGSSSVEVCDILLADRTLVHAKKRSSSSTLSHLWFQGTVAMEALLGDGDFRRAVRSKIHDLNPEFGKVVAEGLTGVDYKLTYLVIGVDTRHPADGLPFFSQVALSQAVRSLSSMGVSTSIAGVPSVGA